MKEKEIKRVKRMAHAFKSAFVLCMGLLFISACLVFVLAGMDLLFIIFKFLGIAFMGIMPVLFVLFIIMFFLNSTINKE